RGADPRRICAAPGDRGQDGRPARARGDGAPHRVRASGAAARAAGDPMSAGGGEPRVFVEAPARLHFGVLDLRGDLGRRFGGIGAAIPAPSLLLEARAADGLKAEGPDAARALEFARRFARHHGLDLRLHFCLHRSIPTHAGLGSGTQLALAVALARLPSPDARDVERVAHLVLMQLLPALAEADLAGFGAALGEIQRITGGWFAPAQGGVFAPGETGELVERLRAWGAVGVGQ